MTKQTPYRIAIIRRNGLGDLLCAMPLVLYCRKMHPEAHITLITSQSNSQLTPYLQEVDEVKILSPGNKYLSAFKCAVTCWRPRYDLAISAKCAPMKLMNFMLYVMRAKRRLAYVNKQWDRHLINSPSSFKLDQAERQHQALKCLKLLEPQLKKIPKEYYPKLSIPDFIAKQYQGIHQRKLQSLVTEGPKILVSMTNNRVASHLGVEGYTAVLNALFKERPFNVIVSCLPQDLAQALELNARLDAPSLVIPTDSLDSFLVLLNRVDLAFITDGGNMHMAAALDKPQVVLFGCTRLVEWEPMSEQAICLAHPEHVCKIPINQVMEALNQVISSYERNKRTRESLSGSHSDRQNQPNQHEPLPTS